MRICFFPCDFDGSGSYRCLFPARELRNLGHEAAIPPHTIEHQPDGSRLIYFPIELLPDADIYVLQRRMEPQWVKIISALKAKGKVVLAENDDYFLGPPRYNPASRGTSPYKKSYAIEWDEQKQPQIVAVRRETKYMQRNNLHAALRATHGMSVTTPFLKEAYSRFNPNITVIPNYLDWEMWERVTPQYEVQRERVRVGWMGKLLWRKGDLQVLRGMIGPFLQRHPEVDFVAAGEPNEGVHDFLGVPEGQRVTYDEAPFLDIADITATFDIGLIPLEMNNFNEAKSDLKGREYAACGIPCIASPTDSYRSWVSEGENGFLARKPTDWLRHLETLVSDETLRRRMGRAARAKAEANTIQRNVGEWERYFLESIAAARLTSSMPATSISSAPAQSSVK